MSKSKIVISTIPTIKTVKAAIQSAMKAPVPKFPNTLITGVDYSYDYEPRLALFGSALWRPLTARDIDVAWYAPRATDQEQCRANQIPFHYECLVAAWICDHPQGDFLRKLLWDIHFIRDVPQPMHRDQYPVVILDGRYETKTIVSLPAMLRVHGRDHNAMMSFLQDQLWMFSDDSQDNAFQHYQFATMVEYTGQGPRAFASALQHVSPACLTLLKQQPIWAAIEIVLNKQWNRLDLCGAPGRSKQFWCNNKGEFSTTHGGRIFPK